MGISKKSHGKKSDKETQSPMLKIFKDIMQKDNIEPEKVTLLKDKKRDKKKKSYSESRSKSDHRSYDSSSTDRYKTHKQANITVQDILEDREDYGYDRNRIDAYRGDKKESWWFWKDFRKKQVAKREQSKADDTCSCVSCALKKIIGSECTCVTLLALLFSVSVVIAVLLIFKSDAPCEYKQQIKRQLPEGYGTDRIKWDRQLNSLDSVADILENSGNNYKGTYLDDMNSELSGDLANILDSQKMDSQTSEKLREFFKKLIQTDVQIKKLKQDINNYYQTENLNSFTERFKRSLKSRFKDHQSRANKRITKNVNRNSIKNRRRSLRNNSNLTGYIIEEEKVVVQYEPGRKRNFPKCSHSHETKSHEKKLKHPFYKHSQRIDEMLKYKKPETVTNTFIQKENKQKTSKPKTTKMNLIDYKVYDDKQDGYAKTAEATKNAKTDKETSFDLESFLSTTPGYDVALSVSTFINPLENRSISKTSHISTNDRVGYRKLMEADEKYDEEINYEDLKEVLTDDHQEHDDVDRQDEQLDLNHYKYFPSKILNPNWKGPMPFYPDELNAMIKQAALQNINIQLPVYTKDIKPDKDKIKKDVSDTEYIEDYANKKFNNMVEMAQAYSDYGVVYNKKNEDSKDKINKYDNRFKNSLESRSNKNNFFGLSTTDGPSEGIRFEYKPGTIKNEHGELINDITKHIKFVKHPMHEYHSTTLQPINSEFENMYSSTHINIPISNRESTKSGKVNKNIVFAIRKGSRSLKSIDTDESQENPNNAKFNLTNQNNTSNIDDVFSFLATMGNWFRTLSSLSGESHSPPNITQVNSTKSENRRVAVKNSSDILYPSYDSDMVDNIGHRSRVLMSVAENYTDEKVHTKQDRYTDRHINRDNSSQSDSDNIVPIALILAANTPNKSKENDASKENMTSIVKRSIDNSKLVFWNGLYDDNEYGVKLDYADHIRDKHVANNRNVMQKSKDWIQGKFKNITRKVKGKILKKSDCKKKAIKSKTTKAYITSKKLKKRSIRNETPELSVKKSFSTLNANMKKVCQEAAKAVQSTRNIEVRDDNKEGEAATSLMQQLVRLMTDLVDIQVQQKTCAKLPSDLQNFLEWLTSPVDTNIHVDELTPGIPDYAAVDDGFGRFDKSTSADFVTTLSEGSHQDDRTECLGTIRAVQDLILQYDGMNDDDKSKMSGVKEYLENQLSFLNKKLHSLDDTNLYKLYDKRDIPRIKRDSNVRPNKFIKNFSKKHTKTTPNIYVTENHDDKIILNNLSKDNYNINIDLEGKRVESKDLINRS